MCVCVHHVPQVAALHEAGEMMNQPHVSNTNDFTGPIIKKNHHQKPKNVLNDNTSTCFSTWSRQWWYRYYMREWWYYRYRWYHVPPQVQHVHPTIMVELLGHNNVDAKIQVVVGTNGEAKQPHDNIDSFQAWCQKNIVLDSMSINDTTPT